MSAAIDSGASGDCSDFWTVLMIGTTRTMNSDCAVDCEVYCLLNVVN